MSDTTPRKLPGSVTVIGWHTCPSDRAIAEQYSAVEPAERARILASMFVDLLTRWGPCPRDYLNSWVRRSIDVGDIHQQLGDHAAAYTWYANALSWIDPVRSRNDEAEELWQEARYQIEQLKTPSKEMHLG